MEQESTELETGTERWPLIRDVLVFQGKLLVDGLRDLVLLPVSLIVGIVSIIGTGKGSPPGREFYDLLHAARRSERWINLFGAAGKRVEDDTDTGQSSSATTPDLDALVGRVETFLVEEYRKGGITAQTKARMDAALDSLQGARERIGRRR
ncbi:MAG TPA: hypothetical protein VKZ91_05615 [Woeseiaceae bacterium]|nr:hypothetical protein [Woeseiaceae bacterium]